LGAKLPLNLLALLGRQWGRESILTLWKRFCLLGVVLSAGSASGPGAKSPLDAQGFGARHAKLIDPAEIRLVYGGLRLN